MDAIFPYRSAPHPLITHRGQHRRATLNGGALQIVFHRAQAAELLAAARPARAAVNQLRQRRTVAGRLFGGFLVKDLNAPVGPGRAGNKPASGG